MLLSLPVLSVFRAAMMGAAGPPLRGPRLSLNFSTAFETWRPKAQEVLTSRRIVAKHEIQPATISFKCQ